MSPDEFEDWLEDVMQRRLDMDVGTRELSAAIVRELEKLSKLEAILAVMALAGEEI